MVVCHCIASELDQLGRANAVAAHELGRNAQGFHLAQHRAGHSIHTAEENDVRLFALDGGQNSVEVGGFVGGELFGNDSAASSNHSFAELFSNALAVGSTVVDHSNGFAFQGFDSVLAQSATQLGVISHHAEGGFETLACVLGVGRRGRDLGNASIAVNLGCGDGRARVQVTDHAGNLGVSQFLGDCGALLGIGCVVFGHQLEGDLLAADGHASGIELFHSHDGAVFIVFTQVGDGAAGGSDVRDRDNALGHGQTGGQAQYCRCKSSQFHKG